MLQMAPRNTVDLMKMVSLASRQMEKSNHSHLLNVRLRLSKNSECLLGEASIVNEPFSEASLETANEILVGNLTDGPKNSAEDWDVSHLKALSTRRYRYSRA